MITRKSQFTTEYLIIVGIGIAIITIFLAYVSLYYISFSSSSSTKTLNSAATSLIKQSSYLSSEGSGSETTFSVAFPAINPSQSYFCGNFLKLTSNSITSIQKSSIELNGLLPTTAGTYNFRETNVNGLAKIGLNQPVSYINSSYALSGKTLSYSLYFYNSTGGIGGDITFNITVLSLSGKQISSQTETASNGVYSGSLSLSTTLPEYLVEIFPIGYNVFASSCFTPLVTTFQEEYLTAGSSWSVSFDNQVGTAAIGNEIYISTNNTGGPFTATATVSGLSCSASVLASVGQTITVSDWSCSTSFSESGLLSGMEWWMDYDNNNISTTSSSITMTGNAGTYIYEDKSPIVQGSCTFTASSESGSLPSGGSLPITYSSSCQTTFTESGLPSSTSWWVDYDSSNLSSTGTSITFSTAYAANVGYSVGDAHTTGCTFTPSPSSGTLTTGNSQAISYSSSCTTTFTESGLPSSTSWWVDYDSSNLSSTGTSITFSTAYATNVGYSVGDAHTAECTLTPSPSSGTLTTGNSQSITYSYSTCTTTFTESGLPSSTSWWVDYDSSNLSSTGTSITFSTAYAANVGYSVGNGYYGGCKYTPTPSSGTLTTGNSQSISYSTSCAFTFSVPVTITNSRSSATPSPFQQMVNVSSSVYSGHAASNFQNIEFVYQNGTVIPSWLESYTSSNALWWLKLGSLPASSSATVYMGFASTSTNLFNTVNDGEAPTLSEVVQSSTIEYAAPITITNSRSSATPSPFQQMLNISSSVYSSYAASNLQNVEFLYQNGTVVHSWLENYTSNHAIWWIKIGSIPAGGALTIYIGFASESTNLFNNVNIGEAPQLSSTYGEYDDGANVFVAYDNFAGTQLNSSTMGWSGYSGVSVNNGLTFAPCTTSDCSAGINTAQDFSVGSETLDFYGTYATENSGGYSAARMGFLNQNAAGMGGQSGYTATYLSSTSSIENVKTNYYSYASTPSIWTIETYGTEVYSFRNYGNEYSETTSELSSDITFFLQQNSGGKYYFNWVRIRNSPPNGVMPSISVGSVTPNIYAEYDDGASVFPALYQNFAGTATPSGWSNTGCTINNGATCPYSSVLQTTATTYGANASAILDYYANFPTPNQDSNPIIGYFASGGFGNNANNGAGFDINTNVCSGLGIIVHNGATNPYTCAGSNFPLNSYAVFSIYSASSSTSGTTLFSTGYGTATSLASGTPTGLVIGISNDGTFGQTLAMCWIRLRAYPPNGVMPSVTFGSGVSP